MLDRSQGNKAPLLELLRSGKAVWLEQQDMHAQSAVREQEKKKGHKSWQIAAATEGNMPATGSWQALVARCTCRLLQLRALGRGQRSRVISSRGGVPLCFAGLEGLGVATQG